MFLIFVYFSLCVRVCLFYLCGRFPTKFFPMYINFLFFILEWTLPPLWDNAFELRILEWNVFDICLFLCVQFCLLYTVSFFPCILHFRINVSPSWGYALHYAYFFRNLSLNMLISVMLIKKSVCFKYLKVISALKCAFKQNIFEKHLIFRF